MTWPPSSSLGRKLAALYVFVVFSGLFGGPLVYITFFPWWLLFPGMTPDGLNSISGSSPVLPLVGMIPLVNMIGYYFLGRALEKHWAKGKHQ